MRTLLISKKLSIEDILAVSYGKANVYLSPESVRRMMKTRKYVDEIIRRGEIAYGVNTGVGALANIILAEEKAKEFQRRIILSHAVGYGDYTDEEIVRAAMFIRANMLARGYSGVRPEIVVLLCSLLNNNIVPAVPKYGSVGASGDLAPLAHIVMVMVGAPHAKAFVKGTLVSGSKLKKILFSIYSKALDAFYRENNVDIDEGLLNEDAIDSDEFLVNLSYKESLSLINGTDFESAIMVVAIHKIKKLFYASLLSLALTMEGLRGIIDAFDAEPISLLNDKGASFVSSTLRSLLSGSGLVVRRKQKVKLGDFIKKIEKKELEHILFISRKKLMFYGVSPQTLAFLLQKKLNGRSHLVISQNGYTIHIKGLEDLDDIINIEFTFEELGYVQDAYSIRCAPKIYGIVYDFIEFAESVILNEINAITDNPIIIDDDGFKIFSAGNFHGQPLGFIADSLKICLGYIGGVSERRIFRLLDPNLNRNLPAFLTFEEGLNTGLMIAQYTAAALTSLNKICSHVSSIDSLPTSANQEDWNSMALNSAWMLLESIRNTTWIVSTEILCAAQAIMLRTNGNIDYLGEGTKRFMRILMSTIDLPIKFDRYFKSDIEKIVEIINTLKIEDVITTHQEFYQ